MRFLLNWLLANSVWGIALCFGNPSHSRGGDGGSTRLAATSGSPILYMSLSQPRAKHESPTPTVTIGSQANSVVKFSPSGAILGTFKVGSRPSALAIDAPGNVWVANSSSDNVTELSSTGSVLGTFGVGRNPVAIAIDRAGNVWVANSGSNNIAKLAAGGEVLSTISVGTKPVGIAVDPSGNIWVVNNGSDNVMKLSP